MWFCFPSQEGKPGQAGTGGGGWGGGTLSGVGAKAVGTASVPHVSLAHPPRLCFWFGEYKREKQNKAFCFVWEAEGECHALGERAARRGSHVLSPPTGCILDTRHTASHPPRDGNLSIPFPVPLPEYSRVPALIQPLVPLKPAPEPRTEDLSSSASLVHPDILEL